MIKMSILRTVSRYLIGIVFVFSGFVKGLDPMGTVFRIEDYFIAYGMDWAMPLALPFTVVLCTLEFSIGVSLLLNFRTDITRWVLLGIMIAFTIMTFFDAIYEPVPDCGCFGDAIIISNWQTFFKNLFLLILALIIFFTHKLANPAYSFRTQNILAITTILLFAGFTVYSDNRLPIIDFLPWKEGRDMVPDNPGQPVTYLIYQNKSTGEETKFLSRDLPWQDTVWMSQWEFVDTEIDDSHVKRGHELQVLDSTGMDVTDFYIANPSYQFILVAYDLEKASQKALREMVPFYEEASGDQVSFVMFTGSLEEEVDAFRQQTGAQFEIYSADDIALKTMIRSNPGLILMKDGRILEKWHFHFFPEYEEVKHQFIKGDPFLH